MTHPPALPKTLDDFACFRVWFILQSDGPPDVHLAVVQGQDDLPSLAQQSGCLFLVFGPRAYMITQMILACAYSSASLARVVQPSGNQPQMLSCQPYIRKLLAKRSSTRFLFVEL